MPPQKIKLHNKTGKLKSIPQTKLATTSNSEHRISNSEDTSVEEQFQLELCWCIQQIENSLSSGKLIEKQVQESEKILKILKSPNQPLVKKRQAMKSYFGDYRSKMAAEEKTLFAANKQIKFVAASPSKKSYFVKKSAFISQDTKDFQFNFPVEEIEQLDISDDCNKTHNLKQSNDTNFHFVPSDNVFKFNFTIEQL